MRRGDEATSGTGPIGGDSGSPAAVATAAKRALRLVAALAVALVVAVIWSNPGEAHAGHQATQTTASATFVRSADLRAGRDHDEHARSQAGAERAEAHAATADAAAGSHASCDDDGSGGSTCCGFACHSAMALDLAVFGTLAVAAAPAHVAAETAALEGPSSHVIRPPRRPAGTVG